MMTLQQISQGIYNICRIMSYSVSAICDFVRYVAYTNYEIMSVVFHHVSLIATTLFWLVEKIVCGTVDLLQHIFDFASDIFGCFCTLCTLVWKIILLLYKIVCFILTGLETIAVCLWTGSYVTLTTLKHSAIDVIETCGSTWNYGVDLSKNFADTILGGFSMIGTLSVSAVKGIFSGLGYGFASLLECLWLFGDRILNIWKNLTTNITEMFTFSKEAYFGILLCLLCYVLISKLLGTFQQRGISFWSWWRRWTRRTRPRRINLYDIDNDFESDFDEQDYESEDYVSDDNETVTEASDDENSSDDSSEDDDDDDDDSEGSLNSQTFSSDDSDHDIEVHLPNPAERYNLRSRSNTPNRPPKSDMSSYDYEVEIEREKDKRKCVVCQDQTKSVLILPCRHMCLCVDCANHIVRSRLVERRVCPLCRQRIQKVMDVYV